MKITVEHTDDAENEVILRCRGLDEEMLQVLSLLRSSVQRLCVWREGAPGTALLPPGEVVNLHHIKELRSRPAGRIEALLETGERLMVSRHYAPLLRERLGL